MFVAQFDCFPMDSLCGSARPARRSQQSPGAGGEDPTIRVPRCRGSRIAGRQSAAQPERPPRRTPMCSSARLEPGRNARHDWHLRPAAAAVDPGLADARRVPTLIGRYTQELGALRKFKPDHLVSWEGPTPGIMSREGGTLGTRRHALLGRGPARGNPRPATRRACGSSRTKRRISGWGRPWVTNTRAMPGSPKAAPSCWRSAPWREADPEYDPRIPLNRAIDRLHPVHGRPRRRTRATSAANAAPIYACGAVFALVAEAASGRSFYKFARQLVDANRADGSSRAPNGWRRSTQATRRPDLGRDIARLLDRGV